MSPKLQHLELMGEQHIAKDIFEPLPKELYPIFAQLLSSSRAALVGERLLGSLRRAPLGWIGEAVVPLIDQFHPKYRRFLIELLRKSDYGEPSAALIASAGRVVSELLPTVPYQRRGQSWVPTTIRSVSRLPVADVQALLHGIVHGRRLMFFRAWPAACRKAAQEVLVELENREE
jgi:hypothetical protein